jgi:hypothetical protein
MPSSPVLPLPVPTLALNRGVKSVRSPANLFRVRPIPGGRGTSGECRLGCQDRSPTFQPGPVAERLWMPSAPSGRPWVDALPQKGYAEKGDTAGRFRGYWPGRQGRLFLVARRRPAYLWPQIRAAGACRPTPPPGQ